MELKYFRLIKTIVEEGNIASSSERLFLTQSALSHQLRELENQLGFKVFLRSRNKWVLTSEGQELYSIANDIFTRLEEGFNNISHIKDGNTGAIRLSAECQSFFHELPAFVQKMGVLYPEIDIQLNLGATHQTISQILSEEMDIAIVTSKPSSDKLYVAPVFEDQIKAFIHIEHPLAGKKFLDSSDFAEIHLLINSFPMEDVSVYEHFLKPNKIIPEKISAIPYTEVSLKMIEANMGIMCAPEWMMKSFTLPQDIKKKKIGKYGLKRIHYVVLRKEDRNKEHIRNFVRNFEEEFSNLYE